MPDIEAIFFDIDDTLFSTSEFARRAREASVDAMIAGGITVSREELLAELDETVKEFSSNYEHHFDKLLQRLPRRATKGINSALVVAAGVVAYHETKHRELSAYPDAIALLGRLKAAGKPLLGIITDGIAVKQAEKIVRLKVLPYLSPQAVYISDAVGINKPNPKLYLRACADLNLKPSTVMYVGDNPRYDIDPPNRLGMVTVRMRRSGKHKDAEGETQPKHEVKSFDELGELLVKEYGMLGEKPVATAETVITSSAAAVVPT